MKNIHTFNEYKRDWHARRMLDPLYVEQHKQNTLNWRKKYPERYLWQRANDRSKKSGIDFTILPEDIIIPEVCPVFNIPFQYGTEYAASVDRIDNSKGYTKDNIQVISRKANTMKNGASIKDLKEFARWALKI